MQPKSVLKSKKSDFDMFTDDEEPIYYDSPNETSPHSDGPEVIADNNVSVIVIHNYVSFMIWSRLHK